MDAALPVIQIPGQIAWQRMGRRSCRASAHDSHGCRAAMQYPGNGPRNREFQHIAQSVADVLRDEQAIGFLHRVAEWRAYLPRGSPHAEDIVSDAICAMLNGQIVCSGDAIAAELAREVGRRADAYQRAAERSVAVSLDDVPSNALIDESADEEAEVPRRDASDVVERLRALAIADVPVLRLLEIREQGLVRRQDAWGIGMTPKVYRGARERLATYASRAAAASLAALAGESRTTEVETDRAALRCPSNPV